MEPLLRYDRVTLAYHGLPAVRDLSFSLQPGEILGIVGESGSGKSTIIKAAMGLLGSNGTVSGDIWFEEKNIPYLGEKGLRKIRGLDMAMIFQNSAASLCPVRTVEAQVYEAMRAHRPVTRKEARDHALDLFSKMGLAQNGRRVLKSYPFALSGGMNQRVGICLAMLMSPKLLFADEPTSALDVTVQKQVVEEMLLLRELFGTSIVIVSHNIGVISAMADTILVLRQGEAVEYGPAKEVLENPQNPYTRTLLAAVPKLRRA